MGHWPEITRVALGVLGRYVRERNVLTLAEAIHKMSGLPAEHMGFTDRGVLRPGVKADHRPVSRRGHSAGVVRFPLQTVTA